MKSKFDIFEPVSVLSFNLKGSSIRVTDRDGRRLHFSVHLMPEIIGTLHDIESEYHRNIPEESK